MAADKIGKLQNFECTTRHRVESEERAFHIVNKLIEGTFEESYLVECGHLISREHYNDIVEERAISHLCGYPLCENTLGNVPKKQYHISTLTNKVYDISERKNFCSNQCLKASKYFGNQIPESPLWVRDQEPSAEIKLLPHRSVKGIIGEEVVGKSPRKLLEDEVRKLKELDKESLNMQTKAKKIRKNGTRKSHEGAESLPLTPKGSENNEETLSDNKANETRLQTDKCTDDNGALSEQILNGDIERIQLSEAEIGKSHSSYGSKLTKAPLSDEVKLAHQLSSCNLGHKSIQNESHSETVSVTESRDKTSPENQSSRTKLDHLKRLLEKRKNVLSNMADIQATVAKSEAQYTGRTQLILQSSEADAFTSEETSVQNKETKQSFESFSEDTSSSSSTQTKTASIKKEKSQNVLTFPIKHLAEVVKSWSTKETKTYLLTASLAENKDEPLSFSHPKIQSGYAALCQRLNVQEKVFDNIVSKVEGSVRKENASRPLKEVPDYTALKEEAKVFQLKIMEFMTEKPQKVSDKKLENGQETDPVYIPPVDAYNQQQIRIKIVLEQLDKSMPDLLGPLCMSVQDVSSLLRELVHTFRLKKDNIVFKPSEWTLVALLLLKILSVKSTTIAEAFQKESATRFLSIILKGIGHTMSDLDVWTGDFVSSCSDHH